VDLADPNGSTCKQNILHLKIKTDYRTYISKEVIEGWTIGKRPRGRKRQGMLNKFSKESTYIE